MQKIICGSEPMVDCSTTILRQINFSKSTVDPLIQHHFLVSVLFVSTSISRTDCGLEQAVVVLVFTFHLQTLLKLTRNRMDLPATLYKVYRVILPAICGSVQTKVYQSSMFQKRILQIMIQGMDSLPMSSTNFPQ